MTYEDKISLFLAEAARRKRGRDPLFVRMLRGLGLKPKPYIFWASWQRAIHIGALWGVAFGAGFAGLRKLLGEPDLPWAFFLPVLIVCSSLFGGWMARGLDRILKKDPLCDFGDWETFGDNGAA